MKKVGLLYRDAGNWKTYLSAMVPDSMDIGDEILMGEHGTPTQLEFFDSEIHPYPYDENEDHNILEIVEVIYP